MSLKSWKIITSKILHQTPWINLIEDTCEVDGKEFLYTFAQRRDEGPNMIAEEDDGRLWMVQQYRHPIQKVVWQFPAEGRMPNESWEAAAQRGLAEEIGKRASKLTELSVFHPDPGFLRQTAHLFLATGLSDATTEKYHTSDDEVEELRAQAFSLNEIEEMIEKGDVCDAWTLSGLYLYQRYKNK